MKLRSVLAGAALAITAAVAAQAETWKLAVTDVEGMERLQLEWGPFMLLDARASSLSAQELRGLYD